MNEIELKRMTTSLILDLNCFEETEKNQPFGWLFSLMVMRRKEWS